MIICSKYLKEDVVRNFLSVGSCEQTIKKFNYKTDGEGREKYLLISFLLVKFYSKESMVKFYLSQALTMPTACIRLIPTAYAVR